MPPAAPPSRDQSPQLRPQPYRTTSSPKITSSLSRTSSFKDNKRSNIASSSSSSSNINNPNHNHNNRPDSPSPRGAVTTSSGDDLEFDLEQEQEREQDVVYTLSEGARRTRVKREKEQQQQQQTGGGLLALDPLLKGLEASEDRIDRSYNNSNSNSNYNQDDTANKMRPTTRIETIHAPTPRRIDIYDPTRNNSGGGGGYQQERMFSSPVGSPSPAPGGRDYTHARDHQHHHQDSNRYDSEGALSPSATPTPGLDRGGAGSVPAGGGDANESSHSAASKRREANRLAAARFRTRKKDQVTELEGKVSQLEGENANLKAEVDVWRSGRDGLEWRRMRNVVVGVGGGGGEVGTSGSGSGGQGRRGNTGGVGGGSRSNLRELDDNQDPYLERTEPYIHPIPPHRQDSDEIIQNPSSSSSYNPYELEEPHRTSSAAGKKRRKTALPSTEDPSSSATSTNTENVLSSSNGSGTGSSGIGGGGGGGGISDSAPGLGEVNRRLVEQMRRYEAVMEGMRSEMREYRDRLGLGGRGGVGAGGSGGGGGSRGKGRADKVEDEDESRPRLPHSGSYEIESSLKSSSSTYTSSRDSLPNLALPHPMSRQTSGMSLNLPPLSPALRITSPGGLAGGPLGFSMASLADAAAASVGGGGGGSTTLRQISRPSSPMGSLSSSPIQSSSSGALSKLAALAAAGEARRVSIDRSRSWNAYSGHPSPSADVVGAGGVSRLNLLASGRDSPVSAERGTAMMDDDNEEDRDRGRQEANDEPMEYFDRRVGSGLKNSWEKGGGGVGGGGKGDDDDRDVRMRSQTRSPDASARRLGGRNEGGDVSM